MCVIIKSSKGRWEKRSRVLFNMRLCAKVTSTRGALKEGYHEDIQWKGGLSEGKASEEEASIVNMGRRGMGNGKDDTIRFPHMQNLGVCVCVWHESKRMESQEGWEDEGKYEQSTMTNLWKCYNNTNQHYFVCIKKILGHEENTVNWLT